MNPFTALWRRIFPAKNKTPMNPDFPFVVEKDGDDIVIKNVIATCFGGDNDKGDNGKTACGYATRGHPSLIGCALPVPGYGVHSLIGSPLPHMPFGLHRDGTDNPEGTHVVVVDRKTGRTLGSVPLIDLGPSGGTGNFIDLSVAAAKLIQPSADANNFTRRVDVRILGGAKYV